TPTHPPAPTETHEPELTATRTATHIPETTATRTATHEPELTATRTATHIPETTATRTATHEPELTATRTATHIPEATATRTATHEPELTATRTATHIPEITATRTATHVPEATETEHPTETATATHIPEHSATATATTPVESTPTYTLLPTWTTTATPTETARPPVPMATHSPTITPSATWTLTPPASHTATATLEPTETARSEATATATNTVPPTATQETHPDQVDLAVFGEDIWTIPASPHQGDAVGIGVNVHNIGYKAANNVVVHVYAGDPAGGHLIGSGDFQISRIEPRNQRTLWTGAVWDTTGQKDPVDIWVVVDPDHNGGDANYKNNTAHHQIVVQPPSADQIPPEGTIWAGGDTGQASGRHITLHLEAHDNPGGSGVGTMNIVEYSYDSQDGIWRQGQSSGWVGYANTHEWELSPGNGVKYLMAWFRDNAGNVSSEPAKTSINYLPPEAAIQQDEMQLFRVNLAQGTRVTITLQTITGDADLFVWQLGSQNAPDYYSISSGPEPDEISFIASVSGVYQIQVFGYQVSVFNLHINSRDATRSSLAWREQDVWHSLSNRVPWLRPLLQLTGLTENKILPAAPITWLSPPDQAAAPAPSHNVYIPWIIRTK
ncbi:MAG: hypothetical protein HY326_11960, partial [Chloroflexi bacterium]|nr:hypothetical protein [Chloroflexota bacterium]